MPRQRHAIGVLSILGVVLLAGACSTTSPSGADASIGTGPAEETGDAQTDGERLVDLGNGRSILMDCRGSGGPTVVLVAGLGERADTWTSTSADPSSTQGSVLPAIADITRVCAYDRPGTATATASGYDITPSTPLKNPATVGDSAADLDRLLAASGEPGPYVLVGHSLGGPIVRLYAAANPEQVAALVFDDALSEDLGDNLTAAELSKFEQLNDPTSQGRPRGSEETMYLTSVVPLLREAADVTDVPTVVLTADQWPFTAEVIESGRASGVIPEFVTKEFTDALWASQMKAQAAFATKYPAAQHITKTDAGHYIHRDNPQLVITSIHDVVDQVRAEWSP